MNLATSLCAAALVLASAPARAVAPIADSPLFMTVPVAPNITVTLDDSGSMARAFVPDTCGAGANDCATLDNRYTKSSYANPLYYNPLVTYPAPKDETGADLPTTFTAAHRNGFDATGGLGVRNLSTGYRPTAFLSLPPGGTASEGYMDHYDADVRCNTSTPYVCQIRNPASGTGWTSTPLACSGTTATQRTNFCRSQDAFPTPAYYYTFSTAPSGCNLASAVTNNNCYTIRHVTATSGMDRNGDGTVDAAELDERQNFANWYSFARTRNFATQAAASVAFADLDEDVRVAWQALHTCRNSATNFVDADCDGWKNNFTGVSNAIRPFTGTHKANFYSWLRQVPTNNSTPLPAAMQRVGEYYRRSGENSPYDNDFSTSNSGELACRRNYHVLMTDGIWNDAVSAGGNRDGTTVALPEAVDGISEYSPIAPYADAHSNTLADFAFNYWVSDLRGSLDNILQKNYRDTTGATNADNFWNPRNDPATWQHMVNFTIGLGLTDYLRQEGLTWGGNMYLGSYPSLRAGTTLWPQPASDDPANVADLWHAAINSRGQFFSAGDPASLSVAFRAALNAISEASGSAAALSANSTTLTGDTVVYQARFADDWSGTLLALEVDEDTGQASTTPAWDAAELIPPHNSRRIFTHNGTSGVSFTSCSNLSADQKAALDRNSGGVTDNLCTERLGWLRGDPTHELRSTAADSLNMFRNRPDTVMGDIVNSDPAYVKDVDYGYSGLPTGTPGQDSYDDYRADNATRMAMVYVGSNDGRVYGIRGDIGAANSGVEQFSYIPGGVYENLTHLTDPSYAHRYYVDGSIIVRDAFMDGAWRTVLLGGLNAGGRTIYALDVTNPGAFSATNVLWEFDAGDDPDLGLTYSRPQIGVLANGDWVAVFGNGYNSAGGGAHLFVVDLATGNLVQKITASDLAGDETNGLSTPILHDADGDKMIDAAYAGDLHGNLWKFDLTGSAGSWGVANGRPLFRAAIGSTRQPITGQPKLAAHPDGGHVVLFGTGRYLSSDDVFDTSRQSFYGVWDDGAWTSTATRDDLQAQWFQRQGSTENGAEVREVTNHSVDYAGGERGWYIDLLDEPTDGAAGPTGSEIGERVVHTSLVVDDAVVFASIIPSTDPCSPGGSSWLFGLRFDTGGAFNHSTFDVNSDGNFNEHDAEAGTGTQSVVRTGQLGITNVPVAIEDEGDSLRTLLLQTGSTGDTLTNIGCLVIGGCEEEGPPGVVRRSWIQIR